MNTFPSWPIQDRPDVPLPLVCWDAEMTKLLFSCSVIGAECVVKKEQISVSSLKMFECTRSDVVHFSRANIFQIPHPLAYMSRYVYTTYRHPFCKSSTYLPVSVVILLLRLFCWMSRRASSCVESTESKWWMGILFIVFSRRRAILTGCCWRKSGENETIGVWQ